MKFLCLDCDEPMKLVGTAGPDEGSLTVTFRCPECGFRVAMLTNQFETQMVKSLGVSIGGRSAAPTPFEHLRASMAAPRADAFEGAEPPAESGPGCPFAGMLGDDAAAVAPAVEWTAEARDRIERIPSFIRPMAQRAIERYAEAQGHRTITEAVMDEARGALGM
jgi:hypothetical protein